VIPPAPSATSAGGQDPPLSAAVRLVRRRRRWGWTALGGFLAFLVAISVYSNQYSDATDSGPVVALVIALALAALTVTGLVLAVPGLVDGVSYLAGEHTATFLPQSHAESCSYHGNGDCSTVTVGILRTAGGSVRSTWPDDVPLGRPWYAGGSGRPGPR